jgi:hypothetical protein
MVQTIIFELIITYIYWGCKKIAKTSPEVCSCLLCCFQFERSQFGYQKDSNSLVYGRQIAYVCSLKKAILPSIRAMFIRQIQRTNNIVHNYCWKSGMRSRNQERRGQVVNLKGCYIRMRSCSSLLDSYQTLRLSQDVAGAGRTGFLPLNTALTSLGKYACMDQSMRSLRIGGCPKLGLTNDIVGRNVGGGILR